MKVRLPELNLFYYPDLAVTCDERDRISDEDFILHPKLIIEVLSDSTEAFDRGDRSSDYKSIPELEEYVLVHQNRFWWNGFNGSLTIFGSLRFFGRGNRWCLRVLGLGLRSLAYTRTLNNCSKGNEVELF